MFKNKNSYLNIYKNLKVLITGSTGFKGSWLSFWLDKIGANVVGVGLKPERNFILQDKLKLNKKINQYIFDITNLNNLTRIINKEKPDIVFHLAASSIVSESYINPVNTIKTNVIGSLNILELLRLNKFKNLIYITSDKCYLNLGKKKNYNEFDKLGGIDNYSSSKACAEILFHSYYESFFKYSNINFAASARAGNVVGGGDFKNNRVVPDFFRSIKEKKQLVLRNPFSTRPWQHVLEPLSGYLLLGSKMLEKKFNKNLYPSWNFGPLPKNCKNVLEIITLLYESLNQKKNYKIKKNKLLSESNLLSLDIFKAKKELKWEPRLSLKSTIDLTTDWYKNYFLGNDMIKKTHQQIDYYLDY